MIAAARRTARAGVTLIELTVAITLVSLLSVGILYSMRIGFTVLERTNAHFDANRRVLGAQRILEQQIAGFLPVRLPCGGAAEALLFQGEPQSMRFVSSYTIEEAARGYPRVLEYLVIPGEEGEGVRLVVSERFYAGPSTVAGLCAGIGAGPLGPMPRFQPVVLGPRPFVIADKLARCRIFYQYSNPLTGAVAWTGSYAGLIAPRAIRFDMAPLRLDPVQLQMAAMTVPLRVSFYTDATHQDVEPEQR